MKSISARILTLFMAVALMCSLESNAQVQSVSDQNNKMRFEFWQWVTYGGYDGYVFKIDNYTDKVLDLTITSDLFNETFSIQPGYNVVTAGNGLMLPYVEGMEITGSVAQAGAHFTLSVTTVGCPYSEGCPPALTAKTKGKK